MDEADKYFEEGNSLYNEGKYKEAIEAYDKAIVIKPCDSGAWYNKGVALGSLGKYEKAIEAYDNAIKTKPNYYDVWNNKGVALRNLGKYEEAIEAYDKAIAIKPDYSGAWYNKGIALGNLSEYEKAIEAYDRAITIKPDYYEAWNNKGVALEILDREEDALIAYEEAYSLSNNNKIIINNYDDLLVKLKKYLEAAKFFSETKRDILEIMVRYPEEPEETIATMMLDRGADNFFKDTIGTEEREKVINSYKKIYIKSLKIIQLLHIVTNEDENEYEKRFAHYTTKSVSQLLIFKNSKFRLSSVNTSNDLKEGSTLLDHIWQSKPVLNRNDEDYRAFAGCFMFNHNCLNQFRLYGKDKDIEGTGVSVVVSNRFFRKEIKLATKTIDAKEDIEFQEIDENRNKQALFRCMYVEPKSGYVASIGHRDHYTFFLGEDSNKEAEEKSRKYREIIEEKLENVRIAMEELKKNIDEANPDEKQKVVISKLLINLRYLTKHVAFREEQECRVIRIESIKDRNLIRTDTNRMFINYLPIRDYIEKLYLGPRATGLEAYQNNLWYEGLKIKCEQSEHPFAF